MSHRNTASPSPRSGSKTASRPASASKNISDDNCIRRIAIDPSVVLGSFYDARTESVVGKLSLNENVIKNIPQQQDTECLVMKADTFNSEELFHKIGIYEESWLNSILNIVPAAGIASILNYSFPKSTNIRFLYYYYSSEEQSISLVKNTVIAAIPKVNPDIAATHVISAIKLGVQVLVVLQLSPDNESNLDSLLEDIAQRLPKLRSQIPRNEKVLLDRITVTKVFSNISTLNNISTLAGICQKITEIKPHIHCHRPLEFTLRTIKWFYPSYPNQKARYTPLEPDVIKMIKQYLDLLSSQIKQLKTSLNSEEKRLNKQYGALRQRVANVEALYPAEIERIHNLVIQIRSGTTIQQESVIETLSDRFKELFKNNIHPIKERLESLEKKIKLINKLDEENIKYLNMEPYSIHQSDDLNTIFQKLCTHGKPQLIFCSTDDLRDQNSSTWHHQHMEWMQQREIDSELTLVYADFTYTSYPLSKVKILLIKSTDAVENPFESSNLPLQSTSETAQSSTKQTEKIRKPLSPLTPSSDLVNSKREVSPVKEPTNLDEQPKQTRVFTLRPLKVPNGLDEPSKEVERPTSSLLSLNELAGKDTSPGTEQVDEVNELPRQQTSGPQPSPRENNPSTNSDKIHLLPQSEKIESSNEQTNHKEEQDNTSLLSKVSPPLPSPRARYRDSRLTKSPISTPSLKPSTAESLSVPEEQLNCSNEHDKVSELPSSVALNANQIPKDQPEVKDQSKSLSLPTSSTPAPIQSSKKQTKQSRRPASAGTSSDLLKTSRESLQENQKINMNEQRISPVLSTSDINLNQENEDNRPSFDRSNSSKHIDRRKESFSMARPDLLKDSKNPSRPSTAPTSQSIARKNRRDAMTGKSNITQSPNSSTTENTAFLNVSKNDEKELSHIPKILSPRAGPQKPKEPTFIEKPLEPLTMTETSSPKKPSVITDKQLDQSELESNHPEIKTDRELHTPSERPHSASSHSRSLKYVNILLLGESGVGKSTFINALVNYLAFETLEQARSNQPFVAMPVSFLMTVGDYFEERTVQFGAKDPNEDHDHPGQSVTQHCRSYVFPIGTQTKLRIIDTPGMGDTRGLEQDDRNMEHILSFINNLPHLNAICILLKPNESRLKVVLRSYFTRFLNFLGENARNNIVFCFTNTRATFYAPGDTAPLLKKMINSLPIKDIPFGKRNTFCFDSESFRYLVALQNGIPFDTVQEAEYQQSWTKSSTVSKELIQFICGKLKAYPQNQWQSVEHAQFTINQLIRPMLETMRNIFRNITLLKEKSSKLLIKVCPIVLTQSSALCYKCPRIPQRFSDFWILPDSTVHTFSNTCKDCHCSKEKHVDVEYKLDYQLIEYEDAQSFENMKWNLEQLRMGMLEFSQFYAYIIDTLKQNDPILSALKQIIAEEDQIRSEKGDKCLNVKLYNIFFSLTKEYKERRTSSISIHLPVDLPSIYEQIEIISKIDEVNEQMHIIKQSQKKYLKQHEKQVS